mgnify:CR=1 FL=1
MNHLYKFIVSLYNEVKSPLSAEASFLSIHFEKEVNERQRITSATL